jgi:hypothetical protein
MIVSIKKSSSRRGVYVLEEILVVMRCGSFGCVPAVLRR